MPRPEPLTGDAMDHAVNYAGKQNLAELKGKSIRVRFRMQNAELYCFWFEGGGGAFPVSDGPLGYAHLIGEITLREGTGLSAGGDVLREEPL